MPNDPYAEFQTDPYTEFGGSKSTVENPKESPKRQEDPYTFREFVTSPKGFIRTGMSRAVEGAKQIYNASDWDTRARGASEIIRGVGTAAIPAAIPFAAEAPLVTAGRVALGTGAQYLGEKASKYFGAGPGTSSLVGDALGARAASFEAPERSGFKLSDLSKIQAPSASTMGHGAAAVVMPFGSYHKTMAAKGIADMFSPVREAITNRKNMDLDSKLRGFGPYKPAKVNDAERPPVTYKDVEPVKTEAVKPQGPKYPEGMETMPIHPDYQPKPDISDEFIGPTGPPNNSYREIEPKVETPKVSGPKYPEGFDPKARSHEYRRVQKPKLSDVPLGPEGPPNNTYREVESEKYVPKTKPKVSLTERQKAEEEFRNAPREDAKDYNFSDEANKEMKQESSSNEESSRATKLADITKRHPIYANEPNPTAAFEKDTNVVKALRANKDLGIKTGQDLKNLDPNTLDAAIREIKNPTTGKSAHPRGLTPTMQKRIPYIADKFDEFSQ